MRISDWSSDGCSSDLDRHFAVDRGVALRDDLDTLKIAEVAECGLRVKDDLWIVDVAWLDRHVAAQELVLEQIGRAACRDRVCRYVWISVVAVSVKKITGGECSSRPRTRTHKKK